MSLCNYACNDGATYSRGPVQGNMFDFTFPGIVLRNGNLIHSREWLTDSIEKDIEFWQVDKNTNQEMRQLEFDLTEGDGRYQKFATRLMDPNAWRDSE